MMNILQTIQITGINMVVSKKTREKIGDEAPYAIYASVGID